MTKKRAFVTGASRGIGKKSDRTPLPGSLNSTAVAMREAGAEVMVLPANLRQRASLGAATAVLKWPANGWTAGSPATCWSSSASQRLFKQHQLLEARHAARSRRANTDRRGS